MRMPSNVGRNNQRALRRMDWCNALRLLRTGRCGAAGNPSASPLRGLHPTWLNAQARELEQNIARNVAEILEA